jgi:hypothetical protein
MPLWSPRLLEPADLVRAVAKLPQAAFVEEYGGAPWLAVGLPSGDEGIAAGLRAAHDASRAAPRLTQPIEFHTQMATGAALRQPDKKGAAPAKAPTPAELAKVLGAQCYVAAIRKRQGGALGERVSVGRAMNQDIVLRHASISKFHAYLQSNDDVWSVADGGSTNGTSLNGAKLGAKESRPVADGDRLTFGSIEAVFLDAGALWSLIRAT